MLDVVFDADGVAVAARDEAGGEAEARARAVIDASGRLGLLARKFALRVDEPRLANIAVFAHYAGVPRAARRRAGDIRIIARHDLGWFWFIPDLGRADERRRGAAPRRPSTPCRGSTPRRSWIAHRRDARRPRR